MKKFEVGKIYESGFYRIKIIKRTDKTVWVKSASRDGETFGECYRKKIINVQGHCSIPDSEHIMFPNEGYWAYKPYEFIKK